MKIVKRISSWIGNTQVILELPEDTNVEETLNNIENKKQDTIKRLEKNKKSFNDEKFKLNAPIEIVELVEKNYKEALEILSNIDVDIKNHKESLEEIQKIEEINKLEKFIEDKNSYINEIKDWASYTKENIYNLFNSLYQDEEKLIEMKYYFYQKYGVEEYFNKYSDNIFGDSEDFNKKYNLKIIISYIKNIDRSLGVKIVSYGDRK